MNGVRVRMAVSSEYTPSVERLAATEKHRVWFGVCLQDRETTERTVDSLAVRPIVSYLWGTMTEIGGGSN